MWEECESEMKKRESARQHSRQRDAPSPDTATHCCLVIGGLRTDALTRSFHGSRE